MLVLNASKCHLMEKVRTPNLNTDTEFILGGMKPELQASKVVVTTSLKQYPQAK
jgi:hypothetical protein